MIASISRAQPENWGPIIARTAVFRTKARALRRHFSGLGSSPLAVTSSQIWSPTV
jgi:hypothetical protein